MTVNQLVRIEEQPFCFVTTCTPAACWVTKESACPTTNTVLLGSSFNTLTTLAFPSPSSCCSICSQCTLMQLHTTWLPSVYINCSTSLVPPHGHCVAQNCHHEHVLLVLLACSCPTAASVGQLQARRTLSFLDFHF